MVVSTFLLLYSFGFNKSFYYSFFAKVYRVWVLVFIVRFWFIAGAITFFSATAVVQAQRSILGQKSVLLADLHLFWSAHKGKEHHGWLKTDIMQPLCYWRLSPRDSPALQVPFHLSVVSLLLCMCSGSVHKQLKTTGTIPNIQKQ